MLARKRSVVAFVAVGIASLLILPVQMSIAQPPNLDRIIFIDYVGPAHATPLGTDCGPDSQRYSKLGVKWASFPVKYSIDTTGSGVDPTAATTAIVNALNSWDNEEHPAGTFFASGTPAQLTIGWEAMDGPGGALATAIITYNVATKNIVSAQVRFDSGDSWAVYPSLSCSSQGTAFDIEDVMAHEAGHVVGLGHTSGAKNVALTMYPFASAGETLKRTLGTGDKKGIDGIY